MVVEEDDKEYLVVEEQQEEVVVMVQKEEVGKEKERQEEKKCFTAFVVSQEKSLERKALRIMANSNWMIMREISLCLRCPNEIQLKNTINVCCLTGLCRILRAA